MSRFFILAILSTALFAGTFSYAEARPNVTRMSCNQAKNLIDNAGALVVSTGTHTYARYVKNRSYCALNERLRRQTVRTADRNSCFIGYICIFTRGSPGR